MIFILLSILFNAYIGIIFKHFGNWKINSQVAIVVNYWVCVLTGIVFIGKVPFALAHTIAPWFGFSLIIGLSFITLFNLMSISSNKIGITLTQAAFKMSLAVPVFFSFYLYNEPTTIFKITGILCALAGVYFITFSKKKSANTIGNFWWVLPILFFGSGSIDTIFKYVETSYINTQSDLNIFATHCFLAAALAGSVHLAVQLYRKKIKLDKYSMLAGIILGVPNYFSIYFLMRALQFKDLNSSSIIPINNVGILIIATLYGLLIFKEKLTTKNKIGISLALISILLLISGK